MTQPGEKAVLELVRSTKRCTLLQHTGRALPLEGEKQGVRSVGEKVRCGFGHLAGTPSPDENRPASRRREGHREALVIDVAHHLLYRSVSRRVGEELNRSSEHGCRRNVHLHSVLV